MIFVFKVFVPAFELIFNRFLLYEHFHKNNETKLKHKNILKLKRLLVETLRSQCIFAVKATAHKHRRFFFTF